MSPLAEPEQSACLVVKDATDSTYVEVLATTLAGIDDGYSTLGTALVSLELTGCAVCKSGELSMVHGWTQLRWRTFRFIAAGAFFVTSGAMVGAQGGGASVAQDLPGAVDPIPSEIKLGLDECIAIAMDKQPAILAARATLAASYDKKAALDNIGLIPTLVTPEMSIRKQQCNLGIEQAEALVLKAQHETRQAVTYSYLMGVYAKQQYRELLEIIDNTKLLRRGAEVKAEKFPGQVELVDIALAASQSRLSDAENGILQAIGALREAMGTSDPVVPLHEHLPRALNNIATREEAVGMALSSRPEMRQAELGQIAFGMEVSAQEKNRFSRRLATLASATDIHAILVPPGEFVENYRPGALIPEMPVFIAGRKQDRVNQANDLHRVNRRVFLEGDADHAGRCVHLHHAVGLGDHAQAVHVHQGLRLGRQFAKAVHNFFEQGVDLLGGFGGGKLFVKRQAQMHVATKVVGQERRGVQVDLGGHIQRAEQIGLDTGFQAAHGF